jgi:putative heme-binding domain-containing protein
VNTLVKSRDGRTLTGIVIQSGAATLTLRCADGQDVTLEKSQIKSQKALGVSLMPEGLLEGLSDTELRDLFAYLRSTQPPK